MIGEVLCDQCPGKDCIGHDEKSEPVHISTSLRSVLEVIKRHGMTFLRLECGHTVPLPFCGFTSSQEWLRDFPDAAQGHLPVRAR